MGLYYESNEGLPCFFDDLVFGYFGGSGLGFLDLGLSDEHDFVLAAVDRGSSSFCFPDVEARQPYAFCAHDGCEGWQFGEVKHRSMTIVAARLDNKINKQVLCNAKA